MKRNILLLPCLNQYYQQRKVYVYHHKKLKHYKDLLQQFKKDHSSENQQTKPSMPALPTNQNLKQFPEASSSYRQSRKSISRPEKQREMNIVRQNLRLHHKISRSISVDCSYKSLQKQFQRVSCIRKRIQKYRFDGKGVTLKSKQVCMSLQRKSKKRFSGFKSPYSVRQNDCKAQIQLKKDRSISRMANMPLPEQIMLTAPARRLVDKGKKAKTQMSSRKKIFSTNKEIIGVSRFQNLQDKNNSQGSYLTSLPKQHANLPRMQQSTTTKSRHHNGMQLNSKKNQSNKANQLKSSKKDGQSQQLIKKGIV